MGNICGLYCVHFVKYRYRNFTLEDIVNEFSARDPKTIEAELKDIYTARFWSDGDTFPVVVRTNQKIRRVLLLGIEMPPSVSLFNRKSPCWRRNSGLGSLLGRGVGRRNGVAFQFPKEGPAEFFDSFGRPPETYHRRFRNVLLANGPQYKFNHKQVGIKRTKIRNGEYWVGEEWYKASTITKL
jgi:hypothetical protein